ncbi:hypothetical protein BLNAU_4829 [Blattamonas nauphoetae]|uniref:Uncharacterized protein n=1 Tax=Blattamonas nauphoetae TaxID=2049346 RepID=A0ABQ9Y9A3_9EUKA|nr:hypothetical protein BLNAU_4829 [Blattamonas nauphoetae]
MFNTWPSFSQNLNLSQSPVRFEITLWHILLSLHNSRLTETVLTITEEQCIIMCAPAVEVYLEVGFLGSVYSALDEQRLLSTQLSDPLHTAVFSFYGRIVQIIHYSSVSISLILSPLESYLTLHLTHPTVTINPDLASEDEENTNWRWNSEVPPIVLFLEGILKYALNIATIFPFLQGLLMSALEARRKENVVVEDVSVPLFLSTQLHPDLEADELTPILDSASSFIASHPSLSPAETADLLIFLAVLEALFIPQVPPDDFPAPRAFTMYRPESYRLSIARLLILSILCSNPHVAERGTDLILKWAEVWDQWFLLNLDRPPPIKNIAHISSELCPPHSKDEAMMHDLIARMVMHSLEMINNEYEWDEADLFGRDRVNFVVDEILTPTRKSLVASARKESK